MVKELVQKVLSVYDILTFTSIKKKPSGHYRMHYASHMSMNMIRMHPTVMVDFLVFTSMYEVSYVR
jgi:hypothetical protein